MAFKVCLVSRLDAPHGTLQVVHDKHRGPLVFVRVYAGVLSDKSVVFNATRGVRERVNKVFQVWPQRSFTIVTLQVSANNYTEITSVAAGNIALLGGLKDAFTGDTLLAATDRVKVGCPLLCRHAHVCRPTCLALRCRRQCSRAVLMPSRPAPRCALLHALLLCVTLHCAESTAGGVGVHPEGGSQRHGDTAC